MEKLLQAIRQFEKAAEELENAAAIACIDHKIKVSLKDAHDLMDRINLGEIRGGRAERSILEAKAVDIAMERIKWEITR